MNGSQPSRCETATVQLRTDDIGRHWEDFNIEGSYRFSNQIPSRMSYTTTRPGEVFYDRGLCVWEQPSNSAQAMQPTQAGASGETAVMGLIMVLCIAAGGVYAWLQRGNEGTTTGYHPMSDMPEMPWVFFRRAIAKNNDATTGDSATVKDDEQSLEESSADGQNGSQPNGDGAIDIPWDDAEDNPEDSAATVAADTVPTAAGGSAGGIDKLRGMSIKDFKVQLAKNGITPDSGDFKSVELLKFDGARDIPAQRLLKFWREYNSKRVPFAIYFVFGLQNGGNRSPQFQEQYDQATKWVKGWYKEMLGHE